MQALLAGVFHGKIGRNEGKDALGITHWNGAGDHPDLSASHIKIGRRPDARVGGQWRRDPGLGLNVVGRHGKVQLGIRQARYFGRVKTKFQLYLAATVANLTLVAGKIGLLGSTGGGAAGHRVVRNDVRAVVANAAANFSAVRLGQLWSLILFVSALLPKSLYPTRAFRPGF